jgi:hypothetical protein
MSDFRGLEGMDLSGVTVEERRVLQAGRHIVKIEDAAVERDDAKNTARLVLSYRNDDGAIRQWIYVFHGSSPRATEVGKQQLKALLLILGSDGNEAPSVGFFKGKTVGIGVKNDTYNGNTQQKVSYHFPAADQGGASGAAPLNDEIPF